MEDFDEDEEMRLAIAASLAEAQQPSRSRGSPVDFVDLTEDEPAEDLEQDDDGRFERELQQAIDESARLAAPSATGDSDLTILASHAPSESDGTASSVSQVLPAKDAGPSSTFLSERAKLEQERLQRQKRRMEESGRLEAPKRTRPSPVVEPPSSSPEPSNSIPSIAVKPPPPKSTTTPNHGIFPDGEVRQTGNMHVPQDSQRPVFRITDVFSPVSDLEFVLLSSFCSDVAWLMNLIPLGIPLLWVMEPPTDTRSRAGMKLLGPPGWLRVTPRMWKSTGVMHVKLMLLFYKSGRLRVVVPTANLVDYDWRDIENTVFVQDLPRLPSSARSDRPPHAFPTDLAALLHLLNVPAGLSNLHSNGYPSLPLKSLQDLSVNWDWSKVRAKVVASAAGNYEGWSEVRKWGHPRLGGVVRDIGGQPARGKTLDLECQGSSVGNYTTQYLNEFYKSASGIDPISWIDTPKSRLLKQPWPPVRILFPTLATVEKTVFGINGGGSFFCRRMYWEKPSAPKELFRNSKAKSGPVLMHTKMIVATYKDEPLRAGRPAAEQTKAKAAPNGKGKAKATIVIDSDTESEAETEDEIEAVSLEGWVYLGSHNFTMAAWGSVSGSILAPKLNISNFELGIVLPIRDKAYLKRIVPWEQPPAKYGRGDVPWMQEVHAPQEDILDED